MNEKILGFRKRDAQALGLRLVFDVDDIVPVVSIEELEKICKRRIVEINKGTKNFFGTQEDLNKLDAMKASSVFELNNLLSAAKEISLFRSQQR